MQLGISSYTYTWAIGVPGSLPDAPLSALGLLQKAAQLGVQVVQIADNLPLHMLPEAELTALEAFASTHGIQIEVGTRGIQAEHLSVYRKLAERFHSPILRVVIDTTDHHPSLEEIVAILKPQMSPFENDHITLAIENHDRFTAEQFRTILHGLDSPNVGICLDTVNSFGALEGPAKVIETLLPHVVNLHVKDFSIRRADHLMGFTIEGTPAGEGRLDLENLIPHITQWHPDCNAILELWTPPEDNLQLTIQKEADWAERSIRNLREYIQP